MAIIKERYLNLAIKTFDDADKYIDVEPASEVADQAISALTGIKEAILDFAMENQKDIRELYNTITSESGSRKNYRVQNTDFAKASFDEYISKVLAIPGAVKDGTISEDISLNAGFFDRDRGFIIALFSTEENEPVSVSAEDAFEELKYMVTLVTIVEEFSKNISDNASVVPEKRDAMDGVYAKKYETSLMAVRLMATSMVRFCSLLLRQVVNNAACLYDYATADTPIWQKTGETPAICWKDDDDQQEEPEDDNRWSIFI